MRVVAHAAIVWVGWFLMPSSGVGLVSVPINMFYKVFPNAKLFCVFHQPNLTVNQPDKSSWTWHTHCDSGARYTSWRLKALWELNHLFNRFPDLKPAARQVSVFDGLVQERRNSIARAMKLHLSGINPSTWYYIKDTQSLCKSIKMPLFREPISKSPNRVWAEFVIELKRVGHESNLSHDAGDRNQPVEMGRIMITLTLWGTEYILLVI